MHLDDVLSRHFVGFRIGIIHANHVGGKRAVIVDIGFMIWYGIDIQ